MYTQFMFYPEKTQRLSDFTAVKIAVWHLNVMVVTFNDCLATLWAFAKVTWIS